MKMGIVIVAVAVILFADHGQADTYAVSVLDQGGTDNEVMGAITIMTTTDGSMSTVTGIVSGLPPGPHGFHIHGSANFSEGCTSTGGHWNPDGTDHGAPENADDSKHLGDLGNIMANEDGIAIVDVTIANDLYSALFEGENSATARAFVIHAGEDDLGLGGTEASLTTGDAGGRLKCGEIVMFTPIYAMAELTNGEESSSNITGTVNMMQTDPTTLTIEGTLYGLQPSSIHGWHIHTSPAIDPISCGADITGGHYNPLGLNHSSPESGIGARHMGDFGNIESDGNGTSTLDKTTSHVYLWGPYSVLERSWVLHAGEDDLGLGGDAGSLATGNAGSRLKCGTIMEMMVNLGPEDDSSTTTLPTLLASAMGLAVAIAAALL